MNTIIGRATRSYPYTLKDMSVDTDAINPDQEMTWVEADVIVTSDSFGYVINPHGKRYEVEFFNIGWAIVVK